MKLKLKAMALALATASALVLTMTEVRASDGGIEGFGDKRINHLSSKISKIEVKKGKKKGKKKGNEDDQEPRKKKKLQRAPAGSDQEGSDWENWDIGSMVAEGDHDRRDINQIKIEMPEAPGNQGIVVVKLEEQENQENHLNDRSTIKEEPSRHCSHEVIMMV